MARYKLMKEKWYPRPHDHSLVWEHGLETGVANRATIVPMAFYDEGKGSPSGYNSNPEHASFADTNEANCYVDSHIDFIAAELDLNLTKDALHTDYLDVVRMAYMPIFCAFKEDYTAIDELSQVEVQDIIEMQTESTDRQGYPLYNGVKMNEKYSGSATLPSAQPGLTTTQVLEGVAFNAGTYYDCLQYYQNKGKLRHVQGGLKWLTLTRRNPHVNIKIKLRSKTKRMNPYTFFGLMVYVPEVGGKLQFHGVDDTTNVMHVEAKLNWRYNEWHQDLTTVRCRRCSVEIQQKIRS